MAVKVKKIEKLVFFDHYTSLTEKDKVFFRDRFLHISGMTYATFYNRLRKNNWTKLEQKALDEVFNYSFEWG